MVRVSKYVVVLNLAALLALSVLGGAASAERSEMDRAMNRHLLTDYGACNTAEAAQKAYRKAVREIVSTGGGVLVIPAGVAKDFRVVNDAQADYAAPGVTIFDYRGGIERVYVPALGSYPSLAGLGRAGQIVERQLDRNLPDNAVVATQKLVTLNRGGSSSYSQVLDGASAPGANTRFDVPTVRGLFVGQELRIAVDPTSHERKAERVRVKSIGQDARGPYFIAEAKLTHGKGGGVYNKTIVNTLTIDDISNADNQSMALIVKRTTYGTGDSFGNWTQLTYQGDLMSGRGDEGGVAYTAEIIQDLEGFRGEVESWDAASGRLVYRPGARNPHKLGTSRPIINLNPKKWKSSGTVQVVAAGVAYLRKKASSSSLIVGGPDVGWDPSLVGRFIAIDEPSERYDKGEQWNNASPRLGHVVRRWYPIASVEPLGGGRTALYVESQWWGTNRRGGPRLMDASNYSISEKNSVQLRYVIAPGAWASDVRDGVAGYRPGNVWRATAAESRIVLLASAPFFGSSVDFAPGDPITQPPAADAWLPTGYRVRHFNGFRGLKTGASFHARNAGRVQVGSGLLIDVARPGELDSVLKYQKDHLAPYDTGIDVNAVTHSALRVRGDVKFAAIDLWSQDGNVKKVSWRVPKQSGRRVSSLYADTDTGRIVVDAGGLDLNKTAVVRQRGLSGTDTPARNLRGIDVGVRQGARELQVSFPPQRSELDARYSITVQPSWKTMDWVVEKTPGGFRVAFSEAAPGGASVDWQLIR